MKKRSLGETIKFHRKQRHLTQEALGNAIGLSAKTISAYEVGRNEPDFDTLSLIAEALHTTSSVLLSENKQTNVINHPTIKTPQQVVRIHPDSYEDLLHDLDATIEQNGVFRYQDTQIRWVGDCFEINHLGDISRAEFYDAALNIALAMNGVIIFDPNKQQRKKQH